jgi:hypothetical protein
MVHVSLAASDATCGQKRCAPGLQAWNAMLHRPGVMAMTRRAASRPTQQRRTARTMKKPLIDVPPPSASAVMTNPHGEPAIVTSHARGAGSIPAMNSSSRRLLNVPRGFPVGVQPQPGSSRASSMRWLAGPAWPSMQLA